ncbi:MAG: hypothetical protein H6Q72_4191 [Firmicutes bacterium]|nr:hypothetical protein [Bacillota bacterium]
MTDIALKGQVEILNLPEAVLVRLKLAKIRRPERSVQMGAFILPKNKEADVKTTIICKLTKAKAAPVTRCGSASREIFTFRGERL